MIIEAGLSVAILVGYYLATRLVDRRLTALAARKKVPSHQAIYVTKVFDFGLAVLATLVIFLVWGIDYGSVFLFASSLLAVLGAAFFAQWSILSNITASIVIFFTYRTRLGDRVRVLDSDEQRVEGVIVDINLFQVVMQDTAGNIIYYPNNLFIQKPVRTVLPLTAEAPCPEPAANAALEGGPGCEPSRGL